ncbi:MAG: nitrate reductase cytochrome c-type subunit [Nitrospirota bacterium]|nr:nitrate reductase cytochrome c-type subunit [Nitrospirota bacterium]
MKGILSKGLMALGMAAILALGVPPAVADKKQAGGKSEEEIGIRKESLYSEEKEKPDHGEYSKTEPGKSKRIERAFENSPPLIPHDLTGMLPVSETNNACLNCHMPEHAKALGATPLPKSHFVDMETGKDLKGSLDGKRYPCMQCHVPQVKIPETIKNTFKADFRSKKSKTSSSLLDTLNEGVE